MSEPWQGFWQVVHDDPAEEIVEYPPLYTSLSLRASGFLLYTDDRFIEVRTEKDRRPPLGWPVSDAEKIHYFRTSSARGGRCKWSKSGESWTAEHHVSMSADPRSHGSAFRFIATFEDDRARVQIVRADGASTREVWRRLSGRGSSPLAGAWESVGVRDRWLYLVSAGHYAIVREDLQRPLPKRGDALSDEEVLEICDGFGANAGACLVSSSSFDHWPMVSSNQAGFEARKHETFLLKIVEPNRLVLSLSADGSNASEWKRLT